MKFINLEQERLSKGWTQEDVAKRAGVARSTYANWENGKREPDFETSEKLADIFEVSVDYLRGKSKFRNADLLAEKYQTNLKDKLSPNNEHDFHFYDTTDGVQFIARSDKNLSPEAFRKMQELAKKAAELFDDEDES